jgi:hypothetical protein
MTIDQQIAELMAQAEPLRLLDPQKAEEAGLGVIVDRINALRAESVADRMADAVMEFKSEAHPTAVTSAVLIEPRRKPGRPAKVTE